MPHPIESGSRPTATCAVMTCIIGYNFMETSK